MGIKKQLITAFSIFTLGIGLIGGGTFAYFSDTEVSSNTFTAGTLDLSVDPTTIINVENIKPGDSFYRNFELTNEGTLDIEKVLLETSYSVTDATGNNGEEDFGEHVEVEFLYNNNNLDEIIYATTIAELAEMTPEAINQHIMYPWYGEKGLPVDSAHDFIVKFNFVDNGKDQNVFQGDSLELTWTFESLQTDGEER
ncbi:TasA family protein [Virgibacillus oceani]